MITGRVEPLVGSRSKDGGSTRRIRRRCLRKIRSSSCLSTSRRNRCRARRGGNLSGRPRPTCSGSEQDRNSPCYLYVMLSVNMFRNLSQSSEKIDLFRAGGGRRAHGSPRFLPDSREKQEELPQSGRASADRKSRLAGRRTGGSGSARRLSGFGFAVKPSFRPDDSAACGARPPVPGADGSATGPGSIRSHLAPNAPVRGCRGRAR